MISQLIPRSSEPDAESRLCALATRWKISGELSIRLGRMAQALTFPALIISGYRSEQEQEALRRAGRPTAPSHLSTHLTCPATGADLKLITVVKLPTLAVKKHFGAAAAAAGLRWGGGSKIGSDGTPEDWHHVDLGPRVG